MSSSLPDEFNVRYGNADDLRAVTELLIAEEETLRGSSQWRDVDTRDWFHGLEGSGGLWIAERGADLVGVLGLFFGPVTRGWFDLDPTCDRDRIGSALAELAEQRAREHGSAMLKLSAFAENRPVIGLLERAGFQPDRRYHRMEIALNERPSEPVWPEGISCTTFDGANPRAVYDAVNDAFSDDYAHHPLPFDEWKRMRLEAPDFDPSLWFVAREGCEIAGICRCTEQRWSCGWVDALGVRKPWRRRGLGSALLRHAFRMLHERGQKRVGLGVDAENPSGATRLYERAGMHVVSEIISFEKRLI